MTKKIKFKEIVQEINELLSGYKKESPIENIFFSCDKDYSKDKIDLKAQTILELYLPVILIQLAIFYMKKTHDGKLDDAEYAFIEKIKKQADDNFEKEIGEQEGYVKYRKSLIKKFYLIDCTRKQTTCTNNIIFDDVSPEHYLAFGGKKVSNNILLKIKCSNATHFRLGIKIDKNNMECAIILIDFVKKKNKK